MTSQHTKLELVPITLAEANEFVRFHHLHHRSVPGCTCTDGTRNANSKLYGAARRAAWALGYKKLTTYTLPEEGGASIRAAGWTCIGTAGGGTWNRNERPRIDTHPLQEKFRWEVVCTHTGSVL